MTEKLKYLASSCVDDLRAGVKENILRYRSGDFLDLMAQGEWSIELPLDVDLHALSALDPSGTPKAEIANSKLVWHSLKGLTPALAYEEGIWVRLTHVECLGYSRARWLGVQDADEQMEKDVTKHFFARTLNARRDDNAIARLWWNAHIANLAIPDPDLPALEILLQKSDVRLNFVERSLTASRPRLAAGIIQLIAREAWITENEDNFRAFMRVLNRRGGGVVFEAVAEEEVSAFIDNCARQAGMPHRESGQVREGPQALAALSAE